MKIIFKALGTDLVGTGMTRHYGVVREHGKDNVFTLIEKYYQPTDDRTFEVKVESENSPLNYDVKDFSRALHSTVVYRNLYKTKSKSALIDEAVETKLALMEAMRLLGDSVAHLGSKNKELDILKFIKNNK